MLVRLAGTSEADTIADVFISAFGSLTFLPRLHTEEDTRDWIRNVVLVEQDVWVAELDGTVIGFAALSATVLEHLYVHPDFQRRGAGTALMERAKQERPAGFRFWVFQKNDGARAFYERHGCRVVELTAGEGNEEREPDALYEWVP